MEDCNSDTDDDENNDNDDLKTLQKLGAINLKQHGSMNKSNTCIQWLNWLSPQTYESTS